MCIYEEYIKYHAYIRVYIRIVNLYITETQTAVIFHFRFIWQGRQAYLPYAEIFPISFSVEWIFFA